MYKLCIQILQNHEIITNNHENIRVLFSYAFYRCTKTKILIEHIRYSLNDMEQMDTTRSINISVMLL